MRNYSTFVDQVAQGNLTVRLAVADGQDELALLGHNLNRMVRNLHSITQQVQRANINIASAASEFLAVTTQQAASATEQAAAITQTTTVKEVKAIAQQTLAQSLQQAVAAYQV